MPPLFFFFNNKKLKEKFPNHKEYTTLTNNLGRNTNYTYNMYTTTTTTRDQALVAAAAAKRAMMRQECCKSQFKFKCFSCGEMINRGDSITRCNRMPTGMSLRYRGADSINGLTMGEATFYQGETGKDMWVHIGCNPCYWDKGFDNGDEYSPPALRGIITGWSCKVDREFMDWAIDEAWLTMGVPYFLMVRGYPKEKFMKDRIIHAVTRFQAIWRGYLYKKAYPEALLQYQAEKMFPPKMQAAVDEEIDAALSHRQQTCWDWEGTVAALEARDNWLWSGEGGKNEREKAAAKKREAAATAQNARKRNMFLDQNTIGAHMEVLMDERRSRAAIYSAEVIKIQGVPEIDGLYYWVKYHHDDDVRKYHWKRLLGLKLQCEMFKSKHGILTPIVGKLPVYPYNSHKTS